MTKRARRRGSSKAGRPRKDGDRYPSGKLKAAGPNQITVERRKEMAADHTMATSPLDCALANNWITERDHRTGRRFAEIYGQCGFRVGGVTASAGQEVDIGSELTKLSLSQMSDETICQAWDAVMARPVRLGLGSDGSLLEVWNAINRGLSAAQRQQVFLVCVMDSWPQWIVQRLHGKTLRVKFEEAAKAERRGLTDDEQAQIYKREHSHWERSRDHLVTGLAAVRKALQPPSSREPQAMAEPLAVPTPRWAKRTERTTYVNEDGETLLEVTRRTRAE